jgi:hypothetical protein
MKRDGHIASGAVLSLHCGRYNTSSHHTPILEAPMSAEQIYQAMMELPQKERFDLVARLLEEDSDDDGLVFESPEFAAEIERRLKDREGSVPWEQLRDEELSQ